MKEETRQWLREQNPDGERRAAEFFDVPDDIIEQAQYEAAARMDPTLRIPDLEWEPPTCPKCGNATRPLRIIGHDGKRTEWRCDTCRLEWDSGGTNGRPDDASPLDRLREAHQAFGRMDIGHADLADAVDEYLREVAE